MRVFPVPEPCSVDAYQAGHYLMLPPGMEDFELSQAVFRRPLDGLPGESPDGRLLAGGIAPWLLLEPGFARPIQPSELAEAEAFYRDFYFGQPFPWPRAMFDRIVEQHDGYFPLCVMGLFDGQAHYVGEPCIQIWTDVAGCGECVGWVESGLLPYLWNFSILATRGRRRKARMIEVFRTAYPSRSLGELHEMVAPRLHDFGRRGGAASQMTGICSPLQLAWHRHGRRRLCRDALSERRSLVRRVLGAGVRPSLHHSLAARRRSLRPHRRAVRSVQDHFRRGRHLRLRSRHSQVGRAGPGHSSARRLAGRSARLRRSGRDNAARPAGTRRGVGADRQETGLKVLRGASILQGDTMSDTMIFDRIYPVVTAAGFCPSNLVFGMGEQSHRCHRSETELAYKTVGRNRRPALSRRLSREYEKFRRPVETQHSRCRRDRLPAAGQSGLSRDDRPATSRRDGRFGRSARPAT